jgi:hypothetical protein
MRPVQVNLGSTAPGLSTAKTFTPSAVKRAVPFHAHTIHGSRMLKENGARDLSSQKPPRCIDCALFCAETNNASSGAVHELDETVTTNEVVNLHAVALVRRERCFHPT